MKIRKKSKSEQGITLVALVVTIIVLLILAGITISAVLGENGLVEKAKKSVQAHQNAVVDENNQFTNTTKLLNTLAGTETTGNTVENSEGNTVENPAVTEDRWWLPTATEEAELSEKNKIFNMDDGSYNIEIYRDSDNDNDNCLQAKITNNGELIAFIFNRKVSESPKIDATDFWINNESAFTMINQQLSGENVSLIQSELPVWEDKVINHTSGEINVYKLDNSPINIAYISDEEIFSKTYYDRVLNHIGYFEGYIL